MARNGLWRKGTLAIALTALALVAFTACSGGGDEKPTSTPSDFLSIVTPTPGTPIPITPTEGAGEEIYVVREGDSLSGIAARFGISQEALMRANGITDPDSIFAGQELIIPAP